MVSLLLPILIGLSALFSIEFSGVMALLLVQPTAIFLTGLDLLIGVVLVLSKSVAKDSIFSVVMIALTGVTGLCNFLTAVRRETLGSDGQVDTSQIAAPNLIGALTYWDLISTMCVLALVITNFGRSTTEANISIPVTLVALFCGFLGLRHLSLGSDGG